MPDWRVEVAEINDAAKAADEAAEAERRKRDTISLADQVAHFYAELTAKDIEGELAEELTRVFLRLMMGRHA